MTNVAYQKKLRTLVSNLKTAGEVARRNGQSGEIADEAADALQELALQNKRLSKITDEDIADALQPMWDDEMSMDDKRFIATWKNLTALFQPLELDHDA